MKWPQEAPLKLRDQPRHEIPSSPEPRRTLSDGTQIYPGHREIDPKSGQQKGYVVLAEEERASDLLVPNTVPLGEHRREKGCLFALPAQ